MCFRKSHYYFVKLDIKRFKWNGNPLHYDLTFEFLIIDLNLKEETLD